VAALYRQSVSLQINKLQEYKGSEIHIPVLKWKKVNPLHTITWELIKPFGFHAAQTDEVIKLLDGENGAYQASATHRIIKNRNRMIISPNATAAAQHIVIEAGEKGVLLENGALQLSAISYQPSVISADLAEAFLDLKAISFPLLLRKWRTGDYFYPLGMQKKKKVSKFLIDLKLSKTEKEKVWVLESNQKIIWVVGYRIDNRCKLSDQTQQMLHISYRK
jgi:tRNA(Ile)-lysidine synthase